MGLWMHDIWIQSSHFKNNNSLFIKRTTKSPNMLNNVKNFTKMQFSILYKKSKTEPHWILVEQGSIIEGDGHPPSNHIDTLKRELAVDYAAELGAHIRQNLMMTQKINFNTFYISRTRYISFCTNSQVMPECIHYIHETFWNKMHKIAPN